MEKLSYKLPSFEGPLDLLLYLLSKHKLDICDIPIAELLEQYMMHMEEMKQQDMEIESEFLTMAARLVHMKTISLLPKHEELEELQDELVTQLLDYQQCKRMAQIVKDRLELGTCQSANEAEKRFNLPWTSRYGGIVDSISNCSRKGKTFFAAAYGIFFSHCCNAYCVRSLWNDSCAALFMERA